MMSRISSDGYRQKAAELAEEAKAFRQSAAALRERVDRLRDTATALALKNRAANEQIRKLKEQVRQLLDHCPDPECGTCAQIVCPHGEALHFHHDGCPACEQFRQNGELS
jgi:predicted nuclease with TOPRIM domain